MCYGFPTSPFCTGCSALKIVSSNQYQVASIKIQETRLYLQLDFFAAWLPCERNQGIPPAPFSRDCPDAYREGVAQFRLGALSADRQALREKRKRFSPAAGRYFVPRTFKFIFGQKEILPRIPNPLSKNTYFFISCSDGKFRRFGKKI